MIGIMDTTVNAKSLIHIYEYLNYSLEFDKFTIIVHSLRITERSDLVSSFSFIALKSVDFIYDWLVINYTFIEVKITLKVKFLAFHDPYHCCFLQIFLNFFDFQTTLLQKFPQHPIKSSDLADYHNL
jgi:hypothetical protein